MSTTCTEAAVEMVEVGEPESIADMVVLYRNRDGSFSVTDNGEEVRCDTADEAVRIIVENLAD